MLEQTLSNSKAYFVQSAQPSGVKAGLREIFSPTDPSENYVQMYVPNQFVLGHFHQQGSILTPRGVFFSDEKNLLDQYTERLENGDLNLIVEREISQSTLRNIQGIGEIYKKSREEMGRIVAGTMLIGTYGQGPI